MDYQFVMKRKKDGWHSFLVSRANENTYYVSTRGAEGVRPTHVQVSAVQPQQNLDVVEAVRLWWETEIELENWLWILIFFSGQNNRL